MFGKRKKPFKAVGFSDIPKSANGVPWGLRVRFRLIMWLAGDYPVFGNISTAHDVTVVRDQGQMALMFNCVLGVPPLRKTTRKPVIFCSAYTAHEFIPTQPPRQYDPLA